MGLIEIWNENVWRTFGKVTSQQRPNIFPVFGTNAPKRFVRFMILQHLVKAPKIFLRLKYLITKCFNPLSFARNVYVKCLSNFTLSWPHWVHEKAFKIYVLPHHFHPQGFCLITVMVFGAVVFAHLFPLSPQTPLSRCYASSHLLSVTLQGLSSLSFIQTAGLFVSRRMTMVSREPEVGGCLHISPWLIFEGTLR